MPKRVNHRERRCEIIDALLQTAGEEGLHAVSMRTVAAKAGVSLRQVQFYFGDKASLMQSALERLEELSHARWEQRKQQLPQTPTVRQHLEAFLEEALPTDEESRLFQRVWSAYAILAMNDQELAKKPFVEGPKRLEKQLATIFASGQERGELLESIAPLIESARLLALNHGLGMSVLVGQRTPKQAMAILHYHLDSIFKD